MPAHDRPDSYTLDELTSAADVTVRTVRYYISEGLLPPPDGSGRGARYSAEHRDRLDLIASLKRRHLPLKEIRHYLEALTGDEIAELAEEERGETGISFAPRNPIGDQHDSHVSMSMADASYDTPPDESSALDYIRSIRQEPVPHRPVYVPPPRVEPDRQWRRLTISPEAELLISDELYRRRQRQIESLLQWARRIVNEP